MRHGSLFSGIGGFDLAAQWMGWENVFHCEWNEFGRKVLNHYWPEATSYENIKETDFNIYRGRIDILTGGFPCQPYSTAGKRLGKEDDRHLWPEMLRAVREIQPSFVVAENVLGLVNWNDGLVFHEVQTDLENEGYEVQPFILPAVSVNAPHRRDRVWFIAYSVNSGYKTRRKEKGKKDGVQGINGAKMGSRESNGADLSPNYSNTNGTGREKLNTSTKSSKKGYSSGDAMHTDSTSKSREYVRQEGQREFNGPNSGNGFSGFENFPTEPPICSGNDGISDRLDGITFPKWRNESIKAYGNAIVPQVVYQIFKAL